MTHGAAPNLRRRLTLVLATSISPFVASAVDAQGPLVQVEGDFYPESDVAASLVGTVAKAEVVMARARLSLPLLFADGRTVFIPGLSGSLVDISMSPLEPGAEEPVDRLYDVDLNLGLARSLSERWRLAARVSPGIAGDFENIDGGHITVQGALVLTRIVSPTLNWSVGAGVTNAFGEVLPVPVVGVQWQGRSARADVLAPGRATIVFAPGERFEAGVSADVDGNLYTLGARGPFEGAVVRYSVINLGPLLNVKVTPRIHMYVVGGASLNRRLEIEDEQGVQLQDAELENGAYLRAGLAMYPPPRR